MVSQTEKERYIPGYDDKQREIGILIDTLQLLAADYETQLKWLPDLADCPDEIVNIYGYAFSYNSYGDGQSFPIKKIGVFAKLQELDAAVQRSDPEAERKIDERLKEAGLDVRAMIMDSISVKVYGESEPISLTPESTSSDSSSMENVDLDKLRELEDELVADGYEQKGPWTLEELKTSSDMEKIRNLAGNILELLEIPRKEPVLGWISISPYSDDEEIGFSFSSNFNSIYPGFLEP